MPNPGSQKPEKARLGEILVQQKLLTQEQLKLALDEQKRSGRKLGRVFIEQGFVTEEEISEALAKQLQIPYINLKYYNIKPEVTQKLPETRRAVSAPSCSRTTAKR